MELNENKSIRKLLNGTYPQYRIKATEEHGQSVLEQLRETVSRSEAESEFGLRKEYWVRYYLENHSEAYGLELAGDLDKEVRGKRGDYRVIYDGREMILEVEKDLNHFFQHGHDTEGTVGWSNPGSIDLVFSATDKDNRCRELDIPVIVAADFDSTELNGPTFDDWYNRVRELKSIKEAFVLTLMSGVYWEYSKGTPTQWEALKLAKDLDSMSSDYLKAVHQNLWWGVGSGVAETLFNRDPSIREDEQFVDLKERVQTHVESQYDEKSSWNCPLCSDSLVIIGTHRHVYEPDYDGMTEGQLADQMAAQMGGFFDEDVHGETLTASYCFDCLIAGVSAPNDLEPILFDNRSEIEIEE